MLRLLGLTACCIASLGCSGVPAESVRTAPGKATVASPRPTAPPIVKPQYFVRNLHKLPQVALDPGRYGIVLQNRRMIVNAIGSVVKDRQDDFASELPVDLGEGRGFAFLSAAGIARSSEFLGDPQFVFRGHPKALDVGADSAIVTTAQGQRHVLSLPDLSKPQTLPTGAADIAAAGDKTALLLHGGRVMFSVDRGKTYHDISSKLGFEPMELWSEDGQIIAQAPDGETRERLSMQGGEPIAPRNRNARFDDRFPGVVPALEIAMQQGVPLGEQHLLVPSNGSLFVVSTDSGKVVNAEHGILSPKQNCEAVDLPAALLIVCGNHNGRGAASVYRRDKSLTGRATLEKTFASNGTFHRGAGNALLRSGPCDTAQSDEAAVCVRQAAGNWTELRRPELLDAPPDANRKLVRVIPKEQGALFIVDGKGGGIWDVASNSRSELEGQELKELISVFEQRGSQTIVDSAAVEGDGTIVSLRPNGGAVRIGQGGKRIETSSFAFSRFRNSGARVLATDQLRLWQSNDYGFSFREVDAPLVGDVSPHHCSEAGCVVGQWLRLGWEPRPGQGPRDTRTLMTATEPKAPDLPRLSCEPKQTPKLREVDPTKGRPGFGAMLLNTRDAEVYWSYSRAGATPNYGPSSDENVRALLFGPADDKLRKLRFQLPFDPLASEKSTTLPFEQLADAMRLSGDLQNLQRRDADGWAIPIADGEQASLILNGDTDPLIWLRAGEPPRALATNHEVGPALVGGVAHGPKLFVMGESEGSSVVLELGSGGPREAFRVTSSRRDLQQTADAIAISDQGEVALIRVQSETPPTVEQPALLLRKGQAPRALAPWSRLQAAGPDGCPTTATYRAIIATGKNWLEVGVAGSPHQSGPNHYLVSWGEEAVCLHALEQLVGIVEFATTEYGNVPLVARFGKSPSAGVSARKPGADFVRPYACSLAPSRN